MANESCENIRKFRIIKGIPKDILSQGADLVLNIAVKIEAGENPIPTCSYIRKLTQTHNKPTAEFFK